MPFVGIKAQVLQAKFLKYFLYRIDILRRTKPIPSPTLKVSRTPKAFLEATHKHLMLVWQHLLLHLCEATGEHLRLVRAIELALLRRLSQARVHHFHDFVSLAEHLPRLLT